MTSSLQHKNSWGILHLEPPLYHRSSERKSCHAAMEEKPFSPTTELTCDGAFFVCTVPVPPTKKARKLNVIGHIENKP